MTGQWAHAKSTGFRILCIYPSNNMHDAAAADDDDHEHDDDGHDAADDDDDYDEFSARRQIRWNTTLCGLNDRY